MSGLQTSSSSTNPSSYIVEQCHTEKSRIRVATTFVEQQSRPLIFNCIAKNYVVTSFSERLYKSNTSSNNNCSE
jgi:hypothetical protein